MSEPAQSTHVVAICASVGGPPVIETILGALPADFPFPIYVVQHIADGFVDSFAELLAARVALPVALARDGMSVQPGTWVAPEGAHLRITRARRLALDAETVAGPHRPSADILFESVAHACGAGAIGVILTGMGRDGAAGAAAIAACGGVLLAQDEASARIASMPRAAVAAGARALTPERIAAELCDLARDGR
jgi:two-component system chemotaxis response regulator CheB